MQNEKHQTAFEAFQDVQDSYSHFGANDTEPDREMQIAVMRSLGFGSRPYVEPTTADDWELFTNKEGVDEAAAELTAALRRLIQRLRKERATRESLKAFCWREYTGW